MPLSNTAVYVGLAVTLIVSAYLNWTALKSGVVRLFVTARRESRPALYWLLIAIWCGIGLGAAFGIAAVH